MKSLLTIVLLSLPLVASAHYGSFKVKGKISYCDSKGANLEEAFVAAKQMALDTAGAICAEKGLVAARVTEWKTDDDRSDCTAKAKARFVCALEPVGGPTEGKLPKSPEQAPLPGQEPVPAPQQDPTLPPAPVPQLPE